jgi:hypothetical protein
MDWLELVQWLVAGAGAILVMSALVIGGMSWLLNHPD